MSSETHCRIHRNHSVEIGTSLPLALDRNPPSETRPDDLLFSRRTPQDNNSTTTLTLQLSDLAANVPPRARGWIHTPPAVTVGAAARRLGAVRDAIAGCGPRGSAAGFGGVRWFGLL